MAQGKGIVPMQEILIVEDDVDLIETYTDLLETCDYSVMSTGKAHEAITLLTRRKPQVVLLDLNLAGYSGTVIINIIRTYTALKNTKIVVATGHPEMLKRYDAARVDSILIKPISNDQLLETLHRIAPAVPM